MIIYPAIDLLDGKCVRLYQGDYSLSEEVAKDPFETAIRFMNEGAKHIHVVDLNAARGNQAVNFEIIKRLCEFPVKIDTGGGIRSMNRVDTCLKAGVDKLVIGTAAVEDKVFLAELLKNYPDNVIVGVDVRDNRVKTSGWNVDSGLHYIDFIEDMMLMGVKYIAYTDISKDGTLQGVNIEGIKRIKDIASCEIIASGGVKDIEDIKLLKQEGIFGAICGKSIYAGTLSLKEAIMIAEGR
ncbi:MAG: 1-(5-phosphoribosyl)-5-((5-phosphoribosylamino)methylideneamino) imidazole-4-carboxamide isomerase [Firmicutes bacterium ADurb.Bin080]|jgi:phosphoribosylformimino-5-aminoimidazole carboxamide ribotide isomerase|nr:1-(5-phosphoribosyl)-5-[(5-phosphoribosylamino)methylideneamino]imidazole-4-carboxamide isomerase [Clostridiales bacterium]OQC14048.1 MAG: 1-(5-phosphoribosyl)-5-((5-phosphoribosylamino)methylideneamino) imidazole-4-carboxamide isomerase [Firmicutes bacterium ADurb.Bin080]